jgi:hypothetical protein
MKLTTGNFDFVGMILEGFFFGEISVLQLSHPFLERSKLPQPRGLFWHICVAGGIS